MKFKICKVCVIMMVVGVWYDIYLDREGDYRINVIIDIELC